MPAAGKPKPLPGAYPCLRQVTTGGLQGKQCQGKMRPERTARSQRKYRCDVCGRIGWWWD